jgi:hypothetical protein
MRFVLRVCVCSADNDRWLEELMDRVLAQERDEQDRHRGRS